MKRREKRYTEEAQIIADIDRCYSRSQAFYAMAERWDKEADELFRSGENAELAKQLRESAKAKRTRAYNLVNKKAKEIGQKLSEFRTQPMVILPDNSIQA